VTGRGYAYVALSFAVLVILIVIGVLVMTAPDGDTSLIERCQAQGGQVILDIGGHYDGCILPAPGGS
jgi:hypothetical protein